MMNWELEAIPLKIHNLIEMDLRVPMVSRRKACHGESSVEYVIHEGGNVARSPLPSYLCFLYFLLASTHCARLVQVSCARPCSLLYCRFPIPATSFLHIPQQQFCDFFYIRISSLRFTNDSLHLCSLTDKYVG